MPVSSIDPRHFSHRDQRNSIPVYLPDPPLPISDPMFSAALPSLEEFSRLMSIPSLAVRLIDGGRNHESHLAELRSAVDRRRGDERVPHSAVARLPEGGACSTCTPDREVRSEPCSRR